MAGTAKELTGNFSIRPQDVIAQRNLAIIIPAHNSEQRMARVLSNLASQKLSPSIVKRVIVCANGCRDRTAEIALRGLEKLQAEQPNTQVKLIEMSASGESLALNRMLMEIPEVEFAVTLNDDVFPTRGALAALCAAMEANKTLAAIGVKNIPLKTNRRDPKRKFVAEFAEMLITPKEGNLKLLGRFCAFRPSLIGEFPNIISVDSYIMYKSLENSDGYGIIEDQRSYVYYRVPSTLSDLVRQMMVYKKGNIQFRREFPEYEKVRYKPEEVRKAKFSNGSQEYPYLHRILGKIVLKTADLLVVSDIRLRKHTSSQRQRVKSTI